MKITTQTQALTELDRITDCIADLVEQYESRGNGDGRKAELAASIHGQLLDRARIYGLLPSLFAGRNPMRAAAQLMLCTAIDAETLALGRAADWDRLAARHAAEHQAALARGAQAFADDGMTYEPGRGRVRRPVGLYAANGGDV